VTACQGLGLVYLAAVIDRSNRVNDMFCGEPSARGDNRLPRRQGSYFAHDLTALGENRRASGVVNRTVNSAATQKVGVRGVHNRLSSFGGDVARAVDLNRSAAIEHKPNCEGLQASIQSGHFLSVISYL
jgi:hypothetical protein